MMRTDKACLLPETENARTAKDRRSAPGLNAQAKKRLSTHLRALYQSVLDQPVPDRFKDLITRLEDEPRK